MPPLERYSKQLFHKQIVEEINSYCKEQFGSFSKPHTPLSGIKAGLRFDKKGFKINFEYDRFAPGARKLDLGYRPKKVEFQFPDKTVVFESLWFLSHRPPNLEGDVDFFYTKGYSKRKKYYYRLVFPLHHPLDFRFQIQQMIYHSDIYKSNRSATKAQISGIELIAYTFEEKDEHFFAIESDNKLSYEDFSDRAYALKNSIGYLTGYLAGNGGYFFAYTRKEMRDFSHYYFCSFRDTIKSHYSPIHTNPYSFLHEKRRLAKSIYKKKMLKEVPYSVLSLLSEKLYSSLDFSSAVMLLMESSIASLLFMPGGYAIVLETLADLIIGDDKLKLSPIKDRVEAKELRRKLTEVIDTECSKLDPYDLKTLRIRVDQINGMTNGARLRAPFTKLGINLLDADIEVLEARNDFLHGRIPDISKSGLTTDIVRKNKDLYYAALRFYTLINMLILKWVGFEGYVTNYPMINETYIKLKLKEPYYRKV